ncbi:NADH oxidase [Pelotomaculum schinkii]|uniref:NADH oxidase n=1 Tax=Pelotomaculum schinkii TaxID=78350 RepID=A0A4Y7RFQ5_9FIRM|nr:NADH:flavin oxidoreductase [Pelotomaculum schinkii]TEB07619.1 NADH oxidase [Pelotomaculum schinkii]
MSTLFQPVTLGSMVIKNRFVRSATNDFMGNPDGTISDSEIKLYRTLAENEVGLIITAHAYVQHPLGRVAPGQNAIYDDQFIEGYRRLADIAHQHGSKLVLQISHAGRQVNVPAEGLVPVAPSAVTDKSTSLTPRALTDGEIRELIDCYAAAMLRAKKAGCDGVQVHIAHGYLLSEFISPYTNRREDQWGGSIENRTRILREIIIRGKKLTGEAYPVLAKLNTTDGFAEAGYLTLEDAIYTAKLLDSLGVAAIEVSGGIKESKKGFAWPGINAPEKEAYFAAAAGKIKAEVTCPVILVGGLRSLAVMESVLDTGIADMVALCRPFIQEPDLVKRFINGQAKAACASCNGCFNPKGIRCNDQNGR